MMLYVDPPQVLQRIMMGTDVVKNVNKNNASHAVLFEALSLVSWICLHALMKHVCDPSVCVRLQLELIDMFCLILLMGGLM